MKIYSFFTQGTQVQSIEVQVHLRFQIPSFQILGLAGPEIQEARERIVAAFTSTELEFPKRKVIVNLAPSDLKKSGTGHDLAMALAILSEVNPLFQNRNQNKIYAWGSLGLDGRVYPSGKITSLMELLCSENDESLLYLSYDDAIRWNDLLEWRKLHQLTLPQTQVSVIRKLNDVLKPKSISILPRTTISNPALPQLLPLIGIQERILELSIIGRHHTLVLGPKGMGKSQMLEWYRWLSPIADPNKIWIRMIYEDTINDQKTSAQQIPIRTVHSQIKPSHLLGSWGTKGFRAGELSLAHGGILIADEFLEWARDSKECLREPLQNKKSTVTRVHGSSEIQCDFQLVATGNLCPCGGLPLQYQNQKTKSKCRCSPTKVQDYLSRLSGPIADRIDLVAILNEECDFSSNHLYVEVADVNHKKLEIERKQEFALKKFGAIPNDLSVPWLESHLPSTQEFSDLFKKTKMSLRSRHKVLRLARTIQASNYSNDLKPEHVFEAMSFRMKEN